MKKSKLYIALFLGFGVNGFMQGEPTELSDIIVSVPSNSQITPVISGYYQEINEDELSEKNITSMKELSNLIPNFTLDNYTSTQSTISKPVVRGLGAGVTMFSSPILLNVDGVPSFTAFNFENNFLGVANVEFSHGTQSTLYGKNAEMGVLNITSRKLGNEPYLMLSSELGSRKKMSLGFDASSPLIENRLFIGLQGEAFRQDGFITNEFKNKKEDKREHYRSKLTVRWLPTDNDELTLRYSNIKYNDGGSRWGLPEFPRYTVYSNTDSINKSKGHEVSLNAVHKFSDKLTLSSITSHSFFNDFVIQDTDFTSTARRFLNRDYHLRTTTQEFRLSQKNSNRDNWTIGLYADHREYDILFRYGMQNNPRGWHADYRNNSIALFGQITKPLSLKSTFTLGGRGEYSSSSINSPSNKDSSLISPKDKSTRSWWNFSPKLSYSYQMGRHNLYATYSQGFRTGGFNAVENSFKPYDPEKIRTYEAGLKGNWDSFNYDLAIYALKIKDLQVYQSVEPFVSYITNAASAKSQGIELSLRYLISPKWTLAGSVGYNRTRFIDFEDYEGNYAGNKFTAAPDWKTNISLNYKPTANISTNLSFNAVSKSYTNLENTRGLSGYAFVDYNFIYEMRGHRLMAYVNNLTNRKMDTYSSSNITFSPPREFGLKYSFKF